MTRFNPEQMICILQNIGSSEQISLSKVDQDTQQLLVLANIRKIKYSSMTQIQKIKFLLKIDEKDYKSI